MEQKDRFNWKTTASSLVLGSLLVGAFAFALDPVQARYERDRYRQDKDMHEELQRELEMYKSDAIEFEIVELKNGFQVIITSDDEEYVQKLHDHAQKLDEFIQEARGGQQQ